MITKEITLLAGARNIKIETIKDDVTTIQFNCPIWNSRPCYHKVAGSWRIKSTNLNKVTLISNDTIIKENSHDTNI